MSDYWNTWTQNDWEEWMRDVGMIDNA